MTRIITVGLGTRAYAIHVGNGLLAQAGALIKPFAKGVLPVVTDSHVGEIHLANFLETMGKSGLDARPIVLPPGEGSKSFSGLETLSSELLNMEVGRGGLIVALGGGVIGDLTGFAAGLLKRGVDFAQVPTTLLAQVDSSVGGKTGINTTQGKNLIGVFHQPRLVITDIALLSTLPRRELLAGYAEVVKYGVLGDAEFFVWLEQNGPLALSGHQDAMVHAVAHSCQMKADIVARDERESGERALLNLGHTFGHALEAVTGYSARLVHGEGVSIGMALAAKLSARLGLVAEADAQRLARHLKVAGLPSAISDIPGPRPDPDSLIAAMAHDKKVAEGKINFILLKGLGKAFVTSDVPKEALREVLKTG